MKYKVSWEVSQGYEVIVEADSPEDAIDKAPYQDAKETDWVEIENDSFYVEEVKE